VIGFAQRPAISGLLLGLVLLAGCGSRVAPTPAPTPASVTETNPEPFEKLSQYGLFVGNLAALKPAPGVIPYDLNSPLFSDYAVKDRFIRIPDGTRIGYREDEVFEFPVGTVIAKTFSYPHDFREPSRGRRLIETRILKRDAEGWTALPYIWNAEQTDANLDVAGETVDVNWIHHDGRRRTNNYIIPNANQCKGCHDRGQELVPIGPKARHLNRDFAFDDGTENQLDRWVSLGILEGAPASKSAPRLATWNDPSTGTLDERARAWLEINCAHCHNPQGPAKSSGLDLLASQRNPVSFGVLKAPVAAGHGSGGLDHDIVPGQPDRSILAFRIASTHPGIMMPELGKRLVHEEGVALIREWISAMPNASTPHRPKSP
jgi:uncharacterized repeat protein (TIGR03806 family)